MSPGKVLEKSWKFVSEKGYEPWFSPTPAFSIDNQMIFPFLLEKNVIFSNID